MVLFYWTIYKKVYDTKGIDGTDNLNLIEELESFNEQSKLYLKS